MDQRRVIDAHIHVPVEVVEQSVRMMDRLDIETAIDMTQSYGEPFFDLMAVYRKYPGRFFASCGFNYEGLGDSGWLAREKDALKRHLDQGAIGVKIWKDLGLHRRDVHGRVIAVDDERLAELFAFAQSLGCPLIFHVADPKAFFRPLTPENERWDELQRRPEWWFGDRNRFPFDWWQIIRQFERVIERHRDAPIIGAHFGCAAEEVGYVADVMRRNPHYLVDTSARVSEIGRHEAAYVRDIFIEFQDRILYGSDLVLSAGWFPSDDEADAFYERDWGFFEFDAESMEYPYAVAKPWKIHPVGLPQDVLEKLYRQNAAIHLLRST